MAWRLRGRYALGLTVVLVLLALIPVAIAQQARRPALPISPLQAATRALIEGRYDEVATLTQKLDAQDPNVAAVNARALLARGRYQEAETLLRPVTLRAPTSEAALELGLLLKMLGRPEAPGILTRVASRAGVATDAVELARAARALRALDSPQEANAAYRSAAAAAPEDPGINTAWGDLFLEKTKYNEALKSYQDALSADPKWEPALIGSARALADDDPPQAGAFARKALELNPSDVGAYVFIANEAADAGHRDEAREALQKALDINPSSLDAHALLAGLAYVEDKDPEFQSEVSKTLAIAPTYGEVYRVAAMQAAHNYRFDEAVVLARRALTLDPGNPRTLADLGAHLLRTGDEPGARAALEASFKVDRLDVPTYNMLQMMDTLDKFVTIRDGDLILRTQKDETPVLQEFALALAHQALSTVGKRYDFTPKGPILIEIFPKHDDFAVRNVGLPGMMGALGACFGRVVTMDSPKARPPGESQWEATLWHELTHVVTLQMSNQRIPRWLTEGISVYEEKLARPEWARGMDMGFASLMNRNQAIKLKDLNAAFTDPKLISTAYFQGALVVDYLVQTFGDPGLHKLIRAYGRGVDTEAALKTELDTDFDRLQVGFDQYLERNFGALRRALAPPAEGVDPTKMSVDELRKYAGDHPESYVAQLLAGKALHQAGDSGSPGNIDEAIAAYERAAVLAPVAAGADSPHAQLAAIALERKDRRRAIAELQALLKADFNNIAAARQLAGLLKEEGTSDPAVLRPVYERIAGIDPFDVDAHAALGRMAMQRNDPEYASREFRAVLALGPVDQAAAYTDLAESYFASGKRAEAKKQTLAALEIAPSYGRAQDLLLKLAEARP